MKNKILKLYNSYTPEGDFLKKGTYQELKNEGYFNSKEICCIWKKPSRTKMVFDQRYSEKYYFEYYINSTSGYSEKISPMHFKNLDLPDITTEQTKEDFGQQLFDKLKQVSLQIDLSTDFRNSLNSLDKSISSFQVFAFYKLF